MDIKWMVIFVIFCETSAIISAKTIGNRQIRGINDYEPELHMSTDEMIAFHGYPVETHRITTTDGYILECHRIPHGIKQTSGPRPPVMVQHGLLSSSADFVMNFPHQSLGFMLADAGFDVWLTNARGNTYGRAHTYLDPDRDKEFWQFSWDQMAEFDVPGYIDYILNYTNYDQLYYIGHSMGTTMVFAMLATKTEYNNKIKEVFALAPVTAPFHMRSPIRLLAPFANELNFLLHLLGNGEFLPSDALIKFLAKNCDDVLKIVCENILFILTGFDAKQLNLTRLDVYTSHSPAGSSTWAVAHYAQEVNRRRFQHCDWGFLENFRRYGQLTPPAYDLSVITAPVTLFWGENDLLADPRDVHALSQELPNLTGMHQVGDQYWSHLDFVWAIHAGSELNEPLIKMMTRF